MFCLLAVWKFRSVYTLKRVNYLGWGEEGLIFCYPSITCNYAISARRGLPLPFGAFDRLSVLCGTSCAFQIRR